MFLKHLIDNYPVRRKKEQKDKFIEYVKENINREVRVEELEGKHNNILIGDVDNAKVVFTAHYDTPAASLFPNIMIPRNKVIGIAYQFSYPILLALISLGISYLIKHLLSLDYQVWAIMYIILYLGSFYFLTRFFDNKNNSNDNTSGVAVILELANMCEKDVGFILFDNEELGKLGSKAFAKAHKECFKNKLVVNLDCVGNGENIIFVAKDNALENDLYKVINNFVKSNDQYNVKFYGQKGSMSNTDYVNFECSATIMACKKAKLVGYYTPRIHTKYDTVSNVENIDFIVKSLNAWIQNSI